MSTPVDNTKIALAKMEALCSRREYATADIREKLKKFSLPEGVVADIIAALQRNKYLDDARYAAAYARDKASLAGWGVKKIGFMLRGKGIDQDVIDRALSEVDSDKASERMQEVVIRKWKSLSKEEDVEKRGIKTIKFALGRGYQYEEVSSIVRRLKNSKV